MATLNKALRSQLEKVVAQARVIAVAGAERALNDELEVGVARPREMTDEQARLRNDLRAHGRQLGDKRDMRSGEQETRRIVQACAYEHWNRMLFARFLAENNLLMDAEHGLSLTMADVQELAREQGCEWMELASELAHRMLLSVFDPHDPVLRVKLPAETRLRLDQKLASLPTEVFVADDSLGWVYQFWQKDAKERINDSEMKIGADELPAVTQLFTEDYMVLFLLENTLGAWWAAKRSDSKLFGYEWTYLRLNEDGSPAAGGFEGWPKTAREITVMDPCMGSGHFLTFALPILVRMRQVEEELSLKEAVAAVLRDNLFGLELDARCAQIAAFNLALTAWRLAGEHLRLPRLNLACSGQSVTADENEWAALVGGNERALRTMLEVHSMFSDASILGSLIAPTKVRQTLLRADFSEVTEAIESAMKGEEGSNKELEVFTSGLVTAAKLLRSTFCLVCTNVPFLGREAFVDSLSKYAQTHAPDAGADISTLMLNRLVAFAKDRGVVATVCPQNWWVGRAYSDFRKRILQTTTFRLATVLGEEAWWTFGNRGPNTVLLILQIEAPAIEGQFASIDVSSKPGLPTCRLAWKESLLGGDKPPDCPYEPHLEKTRQRDLVNARHHRISLSRSDLETVLSSYVDSGEGSSTGDAEKYVRRFWEVPFSDDWVPYCSPGAVDATECETKLLLRWERGRGDLARSSQARIQNTHLWNRRGTLVGRVRGITASNFRGGAFTKGAVLVCSKRPEDHLAINTFLRSPEYEQQVRNLDPRVSAATSVLTDVGFDLRYWSERANKRKQLDTAAVTDPTEFWYSAPLRDSKHGLQVLLASSVGYVWPNNRSGNGDLRDGNQESDGIACLTSTAGRLAAEDGLRDILRSICLADRVQPDLNELLNNGASISDWLRGYFFQQHCELFENCPFIWHIWDGQLDGFHAFVNYHKLAASNGEGRKTLERLTYTFLKDWIDRQRSELERKVDGAETRLAAAIHLQSQLEKILEGEPPYDIFVRWKALDKQAIGWEPDINDGVWTNIRPFLNAKPYKPSRKDSCILRVTPKISYRKGKGKELWRSKEEYPWFWGWDERTQDFIGGATFDGSRWNDLHYSNEMKRKARAKKAEADASES